MNTTPFGTDHTFDELIAKIQGFNYEQADVTDLGKLTIACKILAEETVARHVKVREMQKELQGKLDLADVYAKVAGVCETFVPPSAPVVIPERVTLIERLFGEK